MSALCVLGVLCLFCVCFLCMCLPVSMSLTLDDIFQNNVFHCLHFVALVYIFSVLFTFYFVCLFFFPSFSSPCSLIISLPASLLLFLPHWQVKLSNIRASFSKTRTLVIQASQKRQYNKEKKVEIIPILFFCSFSSFAHSFLFFSFPLLFFFSPFVPPTSSTSSSHQLPSSLCSTSQSSLFPKSRRLHIQSVN